MHANTPATASMDEKELVSDDEEPAQSWATTEALASRLLNPKVSLAEAEEYASYVDQYRNLNLSNELQYEHSAGDMAMYEKAVRMAKGGAALSELLQVDSVDEQLFEKHVASLRTTRHVHA